MYYLILICPVINTSTIIIKDNLETVYKIMNLTQKSSKHFTFQNIKFEALLTFTRCASSTCPGSPSL